MKIVGYVMLDNGVVTDDPSVEDDEENLEIDLDGGLSAEDDYDGDDYEDDGYRDERAEYHERIDMGRNEAGEWLGFM